ncbi:hypothetical protein CYY_007991 [Polysphondylium violaceum]|uniref:DJ-1/PfpI domain-containing protein n=1 Tax=Polysphondylium violaceum TaxID=133409 RepID=A0A8J4PMI4_9MYCE|nr:hypothetical protein CYY_007991 [Polysphondylium violaceum]
MAPKKILIITGDYTEDYETYVPIQVFQLVGHTVHIVSPGKKNGDYVISAVHDFLPGEQTYTELRGHRIAINYNFDEVNPSDYDGLFIPGGRAPEFLRLNARVIEIVKAIYERKAVIGTVCHGPQILVAAGILKGVCATAYPACEPELVLGGCSFKSIPVDQHVLDKEHKIVTGPAWPSHPAVLRSFLELLGTTITP